jgi:uncharacterized protein with HEPN domain
VTDPGLYLAHMIESAERVFRYTSGGRQAFFESDLIQDGVIRNFEVMGEAAKEMPEEYRLAHADIPWRRIMDFRNVLIHGYKRVDLEAVWHTIEHDLPGVAELLEELFRVLGPWRPGES